MNIISYEHKFTGGGKSLNWVFEDLKGKHREHCLCHRHCINFRPGTPDHCQIAASLYAVCVLYGVVTPVYECPEYENEDEIS